MKTIYLFKKWGLVLLTLLITLPMVHAQSRYRHVPRVKVDAKQTIKSTNPEVILNQQALTPIIMQENEVVAIKANEDIAPENVTASGSNSEVTSVSSKKSGLIKYKPIIKSKTKVKTETYGDKVKSESRFLDVKDAQKTALLGYLLWFIFVLVLVIALFTLAFVFLYLVAFTLHYVFLSLGIAALVILALILIFGLTGLI